MDGAVVVLKFRVYGSKLLVGRGGIVRHLHEKLTAQGALPAEHVVAQRVGRSETSK